MLQNLLTPKQKKPGLSFNLTLSFTQISAFSSYKAL